MIVHVPKSKLLLSIVLLVTGAAGCHHMGMWSMRGMEGAVFHSRMTYLSFVTTAGLGGLVCVVAVLVFLLAPRGAALLICAAVLAIGVGAFHYSSTIWGLEYVEGRPGLAWGPVMDEEVILVFVLLQVPLPVGAGDPIDRREKSRCSQGMSSRCYRSITAQVRPNKEQPKWQHIAIQWRLVACADRSLLVMPSYRRGLLLIHSHKRCSCPPCGRRAGAYRGQGNSIKKQDTLAE